MPNIYVRNSDGNNADDGSTWALAKATLAGATAIDAAGDSIYVSQSHSETTPGNVSLFCAGVAGNPVKIVCGNDAVEPPTAISEAAIVACTGTVTLGIYGRAYIYGINFLTGDATGASVIDLGNSYDIQVYERCSFQFPGTGNCRLRITAATTAGATQITWVNCDVKFGGTGQLIVPWNTLFIWHGGSFLAGSATPANLFENSATRFAKVVVDNVDFSNLGTTFDIADSSNIHVTMSNCKLPSGWSGALINGTTATGTCRVEMFNCDSGDSNYLCRIQDGYGSLIQDSGIYLSGTDGIKHNGVSVPLSYKLSGTSFTSYGVGSFEGMWMPIVNEVTTEQTVTLEIIHNESANLNDDEIFLELDYPATAGSTLYTRATDTKASVLATGAAQATSTAAWDSGLTERANSTAYVVGNIIKSADSAGSAFICTVSGTSAASAPAGYTSASDGATITDGTATFKAMRRQKLEVTFTAAEQGVIKARPVLAKNAVVWVASKISVA